MRTINWSNPWVRYYYRTSAAQTIVSAATIEHDINEHFLPNKTWEFNSTVVISKCNPKVWEGMTALEDCCLLK